MKNKPQQQGPQVPEWKTDKNSHPVPIRDASFWRSTGKGRAVECLLCWKNCTLQPGERGPCRYRGVDAAGKMQLYAHGQIGALYPMMLGYGVGSLCYMPGIRAVGVGALECNFKCAFCYVSSFSTHTERMPQNPSVIGSMGGWYGYKTYIHPRGIVEGVAPEWNCRALAFSWNDPVAVSWEYTYDTARLACAVGLKTIVFTNGSATEPATRKLAPYISLVKVGIKGGGDPDFYQRYMRAGGAMDAVYRSMLVWRECGVRVGVADVIAPPQQQTDEQAAEAQKRLYSWIAEHLGTQTVLSLGEMHRFSNNIVNYEPLVSSRIADARQIYEDRQERAREIARAAGLHYTERDREASDRVITCHQCGAALIRKAAPYYDGEIVTHTPHEQFVTDGRCNNCNADVPVVTLPADVLHQQLEYSIHNPAPHAMNVVVREMSEGGWGHSLARAFI